MSPPVPGTPTSIVASTFIVKGLIFVTVPLVWFSVHTPPSPAAINRGAGSTGISAMTSLETGLITDTRFFSVLETHTNP